MAADIVYRGEQVADVRRIGSEWLITLYPRLGGNPVIVPLAAFSSALREASDRLERLS